MNRRFYMLTGSAALAVMALIYMGAGNKSLAPVGEIAGVGNSPALADHMPTTQPNGSLLPSEYAFLQTQSPFGSAAGSVGASQGGPEATFIFRGAVQTGSRITAFIEDSNAKKVAQMAVGDSLARGRIKAIDLDAIEYEALGDSKRIEVGHNLRGDIVQPPAATAPSVQPAPGAGNSPANADQNGNAPQNPQAPPMPPGKQG